MPTKHDHVGNMLFDDDWCACKVCEQQWKLDLKRGWIPMGPGGIQAAPQKPKYYQSKYKKPYKVTRPQRPKLRT